MYSQNGIPILVIIVEPLIALAVLTVTIASFRKYFQRRRQASLMISLSFLAFFFAIVASTIGKLYQFFASLDLTLYDPVVMMILVTFLFCVFGSYFIFAFINEIFLNANQLYTIFLAIISGGIIGWIIPQVTMDISVNDILIDVSVVVFVFVFLICLTLIILCMKEARRSEEKLPKVGYWFITFYGIFIIFIFVFFVISIIIGTLTQTSFSIFYYLGWVCVFLGTFSGYLGYNMPSRLRKLLKIS